MTNNAPPLLRWTRFTKDPPDTGSERRSAQIRAICEQAGLAISDMRPPDRVSRPRAWLAGLQARRLVGRRASVDRAGIGLLGYRMIFYREALARHQGARLLLWETTYDSLLPTLARNAGYRVIALPHNLESFVSEPVFADSNYDPIPDLGAEIERLRLADAVFTIAKEERWLLETRGLASQYLPFYPDPATAADCRAIREARLARAGANGRVSGPFLLLGSAFNPASAQGMRRQLAWLAAAGLPAASIVVAGAHTDVALAAECRDGVKAMGRVSQAELSGLLGQCAALLIHTEGGAGAVTRIPEALLAGIPVIANANAARDQYGTAGVHVYESEAGFRELIARPLAMPPPLPEPREAQERLIETIRLYLDATPLHAGVSN